MTDAPAPDFSAFVQAAQAAFNTGKFLLCISLLEQARELAIQAQNASVDLPKPNDGEIRNG